MTGAGTECYIHGLAAALILLTQIQPISLIYNTPSHLLTLPILLLSFVHHRLKHSRGHTAAINHTVAFTSQYSLVTQVDHLDPRTIPINMGMSYRRYLAGARIYGCSECKTHLATIHSMISRAFNGQHGRAYLFENVVNVIEGEPVDRQMTTGNHTVRDIYCCKCGRILGWKYDKAYEPSQRYKEGKFILERNLLSDVQ